ncbi:LysR family transcriptional regulator [Parathalassolituus penaei]|uniref:LysR family transcriptional regulator n=1 Tax=Parathalassolituus penaei TaxID=2997323 RepID=A0A9X3EI73_9GAMM|nr:LysR family transcriptional regulator [Parathalassolituus penaei]MCY0964726.1 LysR family transcriptional regulator [Parathalassolituus penaei]
MRDIRSLDFNLLKALDALLDERNVTRAAQRLGVTQPALSGMLARLRESFGDPLFTRTQRGIVPTARALELVVPLKNLLQDIEGLLQPPAFDPATARMTFSIAATDYALRAVGRPFLRQLRQTAPGIQVALLPVQDKELHERMERGDIDLALLTPDITPADLHARRLFDETYVVAMREHHPAAIEAASSGLSLERFCALEHVLVSYSGGSFTGITDEVLAQQGLQRRVMVSVRSFLIVPELLLDSDLVAVVPSRLVSGWPGLITLPPPVAIPGFTKTAAWHERVHRDPAQRWLREQLFGSCEIPL